MQVRARYFKRHQQIKPAAALVWAVVEEDRPPRDELSGNTDMAEFERGKRCGLRTEVDWRFGGAAGDLVAQRDLLGGAALLPVAQRNAERDQQDGNNEGDGPKTEAQTHYNGASKILIRPTMKIFVAIAFALILASLGSALFFLMRDKGKSNRTVQALAMRVGLSITLFLLVLGMYKLGWIQPKGLPY
jgi:hypothetical protein